MKNGILLPTLALAVLSLLAPVNLQAQEPPGHKGFVVWNGFQHTSGKPVRFARLGDRIRDLGMQNGAHTGRHTHTFASRESSPRALFTSYATAVWSPHARALQVPIAFTFSGRPNRDHTQNISLRQPIPAEWLQYSQATAVINGFQLQRKRGPAPAYSLLDIRLSSANLDDTDTVLEFEAAATLNPGPPGFLRRKGQTFLVVECLLVVSDTAKVNQRLATIRQPDAWNRRDTSSSTVPPRPLAIDAHWSPSCQAGAIGIAALRVVTTKPFRCERLAAGFEAKNYTARGGKFDIVTHYQYRTVPPGAPRRQRQRGASEIRMDVVLLQFKEGKSLPVRFEGQIDGSPRGMPAEDANAEYQSQFVFPEP
jgi:hypothetical protein